LAAAVDRLVVALALTTALAALAAYCEPPAVYRSVLVFRIPSLLVRAALRVAAEMLAMGPHHLSSLVPLIRLLAAMEQPQPQQPVDQMLIIPAVLLRGHLRLAVALALVALVARVMRAALAQRPA
jgi:hypothetical protein